MNLMSHGYSLFFACLVCASIEVRADSSSAATKVVIFKCLSDSGKLSFQKSPCPGTDVTQRLRVTGDSQANRDAARQLAVQAAADSAEQKRRDEEQERVDYLAAQAQVRANAANAVQSKPPVVCPRIDSDGVKTGRLVEYGEGGQKRYRSSNQAFEERGLSKTFLKNAGLWPDECPQ